MHHEELSGGACDSWRSPPQDLVADNLSASSVEGASGSRLALASPSGPGVGAWLAEAWLATSPGSVQRAPFLLEAS